MENTDLQKYTNFIIDFLEPIVRVSENPENARVLLIELGYEAPSEVTAFGELGNIVGDLFDLISSIDELIESNSDDNAKKDEILLELFIKIGNAVKHLNNFNTKIQQNFAGTNFLLETDILAELPIKLVDYLIVIYLEKRLSNIHSIFIFIGIIEESYIEGTAPHNTFYKKRKIYWEKIPQLFTDPIQSLKDIFIDGDEFKFDKIIYILEQIGVSLGVFAEVNLPEIAKINAFNSSDLTTMPSFDDIRFLRFPLISDPHAELALEIYPIINTTNEKCEGIGAGLIFGSQLEIPLGDKFRLKINFSTSLLDSLGVKIDKNGNFSFINSIFSSPETLAESIQISFKAIFESLENPLAGKLLEIGAPGGSRMEIGSGSFTLGVEKKGTDANIYVELDMKDGLALISLGDPDSFIDSILANNNNMGVCT